MTYSVEIVERIKAKHRLRGEPVLMPFTGMVNEAWSIGDEYGSRSAMSALPVRSK